MADLSSLAERALEVLYEIPQDGSGRLCVIIGQARSGRKDTGTEPGRSNWARMEQAGLRWAMKLSFGQGMLEKSTSGGRSGIRCEKRDCTQRIHREHSRLSILIVKLASKRTFFLLKTGLPLGDSQMWMGKEIKFTFITYTAPPNMFRICHLTHFSKEVKCFSYHIKCPGHPRGSSSKFPQREPQLRTT